MSAVVFPVVRSPETISPRRAPCSRWLSRVSSRPWWAIVLDRGRAHDLEFGVVGDAGLVVGVPHRRAQRLPLLLGQQVEDGRVLFDEPAPALQPGGRVCAVLAGLWHVLTFRLWRVHHHRSASLRASKISSGITSASSPSSVSTGSPAGSSAGSLGRGQEGSAVARVRAATLRSRPLRRDERDGSAGLSAGPSAARSSRRDGGLGDLVLGRRVGAALGQDAAGVVPGKFAHRHRGGAKVPPDGGDPAALAVVAYPDAGDVVGVVVDLPAPPVCSGDRTAGGGRGSTPRCRRCGDRCGRRRS